MSLPIFPRLPGISYESTKVPLFSTAIQTAASGRESRGAFRLYPKWKFTLNYKWLRAGDPYSEYETAQAFYLSTLGSYGSFWYLDPTDSVCTDMPFGVGDGVKTVFQLTRSFGFDTPFPFIEPVQNLKTLSAIKNNDVVKTAPGDYTILSTGLVTFAAPPANGAVLTWTGEFYYRCRFGDETGSDTGEFTRAHPDYWTREGLLFVGAPGNKV